MNIQPASAISTGNGYNGMENGRFIFRRYLRIKINRHALRCELRNDLNHNQSLDQGF